MPERYQVPLFAGDTDILTLPVTHGNGGSNVLLVEISSLTLSLTDRATGGIVNSRNAQNVLNTNNVMVSDGSIEWQVQALDTEMVTAGSAREVHIAVLDMTLTDGQERTAQIKLVCDKRTS